MFSLTGISRWKQCERDSVKKRSFLGQNFPHRISRVCQRNKEIYCEFSFLSLPDEAYASALLLPLLLKEYICWFSDFSKSTGVSTVPLPPPVREKNLNCWEQQRLHSKANLPFIHNARQSLEQFQSGIAHLMHRTIVERSEKCILFDCEMQELHYQFSILRRESM